jgi:hypothetical protein
MVKTTILMILQGIKEPRHDLPLRTIDFIRIEQSLIVATFIIILIALSRLKRKDKRK